MSMPPRVTVNSEMSVDEVQEWRARLKLPAIGGKPWWKIW
jgi:hypothetical protein